MSKSKKSKNSLAHKLTDGQDKALATELAMRRFSDSWYNPITGIGGFQANPIDKTEANMAGWFRLNPTQAEHIFAGDRIARVVVEKVVKASFSQGIKIKTPDLKSEGVSAFNNAIKEIILKPYDLMREIIKAATWGRLYGSAYLLFNIDDGRHPSDPVDYENIRDIKWARAMTPLEIYVLEKNYTVEEAYLEPEYYTFVSYGAQIVEKVHRTRIVRFIGEELPRYLYIANHYRHDSVINNIYRQLSNYAIAIQSAGFGISEFSQAVFRVKGLSQMLMSGNSQKIMDRMFLMNQSRSLVRAIVLDENEDFQRLTGNFSGLSELIQEIKKDLVARTNIPHNILFNEGAGREGSLISSGADGESELSDWQAEVSEYQRTRLKDPLYQIFRLMFLNKSNRITGGFLPDFECQLNSDRPMTLRQEAEVYGAITATDLSLLDKGLITPKELRDSRLGKEGLFSEFNLALESGDEWDENFYKEKEEKAQQMQQMQGKEETETGKPAEIKSAKPSSSKSQQIRKKSLKRARIK